VGNEIDVDRLEEMLRRLRVEVDLYTSGQRRRPPTEEKNALDQAVKRLGAGGHKDSAERFRYNNFVVKWGLYSERFEKGMREREEGPIDYRRRRMALAGVGKKAPAPAAPAAPAPETAKPADAGARSSVEIVVGRETPDDVKRIFEQYMAARKTTGEAAPVSFDRFQKLIGEQTSAIARKTGSLSVEFDVKVADGKAKLVARPKGKSS
jgi:hypothetical protein